MRRVLARCVISASVFSIVWASAGVILPPSFLDGLTAVEMATQLFGASFAERLTWFLLHWLVGAFVFLVSAGWITRLSLFGAAWFGLISGAYVYVLMPPVDLFGSVIDWTFAASQEDLLRRSLGAFSVLALVAALPTFGIALASIFSDARKSPPAADAG